MVAGSDNAYVITCRTKTSCSETVGNRRLHSLGHTSSIIPFLGGIGFAAESSNKNWFVLQVFLCKSGKLRNQHNHTSKACAEPEGSQNSAVLSI